MKKFLLILLACCLCSGCVTLQRVTVSEEEPEDLTIEVIEEEKEIMREILESPDTSPELQNIESDQLEVYVENKGVIFAKTDFQGLLATRYVKFLFEDLEDQEHKFQLHIGESSDQQTFPWDVKSVQPGYFFVELPVGRYKISSVSIPVGSTMATEEMDVRLEVIPNEVCYVGTLKMVGTKEKIKLGGLPVIKPGFEFTVEVIDEQVEGIESFRQQYPNFLQDISVKLMQVSSGTPESI